MENMGALTRQHRPGMEWLGNSRAKRLTPYICNRTGAANASREHGDDAIENKQTKLSLQADLVVADITITYEREQVLLSYSTSLSSACFIHNVCFVNIWWCFDHQGVDFTMPFMNLGVTILYKKPTKKASGLFPPPPTTPLNIHQHHHQTHSYVDKISHKKIIRALLQKINFLSFLGLPLIF